MSSGRKRKGAEQEESQAECPFSVTYPNPNAKAPVKKRKRQESEPQATPAQTKINFQPSPFAPAGKFKDETAVLDRHYQVQPSEKWLEMTRYNSFVLNGVKYFSEGFVFVANDSTIVRQQAPAEGNPPSTKSDQVWVARILEIRAQDEHHVYARVYWMYWPDELPAGTQDGKRIVSGRQHYHGENELIASNHMDVINVVSVTMKAKVEQWIEENEEEVQQALYWRQALDIRNMELSSVALRCKCRRPENPDKRLIGCTNDSCKMWLHDDCLIHETLLKTFKELGTDKPHKPKSEIKADEDGETKRPLSPSESGVLQHTEQSIDVKSGDTKPAETPDTESSTPAPAMNGDKASIVVPVSAEPPKKRGRKKAETSDTKPYDGLFSATINNEASPPYIEVEDLRKNITGGEKTWRESMNCLVCGHEIS